ncbi:DUF5675 family protein [Alteromonas sp. C1M14]|uniref:DUF5675 family protein n=1 Tax=Alteromonas sp. C1M14 TaxID=2841567 RepID=UPI001C093D68|nr:DUF5675 family protein [Alteromonas sp. C1M14]MBU2978995.1 hypothetical protein [Alteromonas sp. C1M14]
MNLWINRLSTDDQGTPGHLFIGPWVAQTLELPWRDNQQNISCIPAGEYPIRLVKTRKPIGGRSNLYLIDNVPGRSGILFHAGTWAGDKSKGFKSSVLGCVLTGYRSGIYQDQRAIFDTRRAVGDMLSIMAGKAGTIKITNGWEG